jgi:bis(5'-nucleosyl)-tetraphosphatase (symmetrical)
MAVYAIGDIQGCYEELRRLLDQIDFNPLEDRLWFVGDLVNRGPDSLAVLRFVRRLGDRAICVLGNHDLHLLALAAGNPKHAGTHTLGDVLSAPDRDELLDWLRHRPLLHHDAALGFTMVHAGLPPQWDIATARDCAAEVEQVLRSPDRGGYFLQMYGNKPARWDPALSGMDRWRFTTNCLTRLRYCDQDGGLCLKEKGPPGSQARGRVPWFQHPARRSAAHRIVFGHWSTLGYSASDNTWGIDTGCLWGGGLTLLRLDGPVPTRITRPCQRWQSPARTVG